MSELFPHVGGSSNDSLDTTTTSSVASEQQYGYVLSPYSDLDPGPLKEEDVLLPDLVLLDTDWIFLTTNIVGMVISLMSNVYVIYFICGQKRARSAQNISIVSIAVADIVVASFVVPTHVVIHILHAERYSDDLSPFLCKLHTYTWFWCKTVTIYSLSALICDRYARISQPQKSHILSGRYMFFLSFVWFFGAAYNVWQIVLKVSDYIDVSGPNDHNYTIRMCITADQFRYLQHWLIAGDMLVIYAVPLAGTIYMYGTITYHLCKQDNARHRVTSKKRLLLSVFLLLLFVFCQLPLDIINAIIFVTKHYSYGIIIAKKITEVMSLWQGALNIIVYAAFSSEFHVALKKQLGKTKGRYYSRVAADGGRRTGVPQIEVSRADQDTMVDVTVEMTVMPIQGPNPSPSSS